MKKPKVELFKSSFTDADGEHHFVLSAVSEMLDEPITDNYETMTFVKGVKIGVSICSPSDVYNDDLGVKIATGRAIKNSEYALVASHPGYLNSTIIKAFLEQEGNYFKKNPEYFIKGYKRV